MKVAILIEDGFAMIGMLGNLLAAICNGPWAVVKTGGARGLRVASWPSLKTDLRNAGAEWMDQEAVVDGNLVWSQTKWGAGGRAGAS